MPKYTVLVHQYVEQVGQVEIEADNPGAAAQKFESDRYGFEVAWEYGDDQDDPEAYSVLDEQGEMAWECGSTIEIVKHNEAS